MYHLNLLSPNSKLNLLATIGEFIGSFIFLLFGSLIMQESATIGNDEHMRVMMGALGFGFGMMTSIYIFNDISGVHLTPPITIAQTLVGNSPVGRMFLFIPAQIASGIAAAFLVDALTPGEAAFAPRLAVEVNVAQGFFIELFGSTIINLSVLFITQHTKGVHPSVVIVAPCVGISGFVGHLFSIYYSGGSLNPARAIGACLADERRFPYYFWIYIVAPICSSLLSVVMFGTILRLTQATVGKSKHQRNLERSRKKKAKQRQKMVIV